MLVGHSLGCIAIVKWALVNQTNVAGAFLVSPADVESDRTPESIQNFAPIPTQKLSFPAQIVASSDDNFLSVERALEFADWWGARVTNIGSAGHIATDSGYGSWSEGQALLANFIATL